MSKVRNTQTVLILLAIAIALLTIWSYRSLGRYRPFADLMDPRMNIMSPMELQVSDATVTGRSSGKVQWRVKASTISVSRDRFTITADDIHDGVAYDAAERPILRMSARHAAFQSPGGLAETTPSSFLQLTGGIQAQILKFGGPTIHTENLIWDARNHLVQAPGQVSAVFPGGAGAVSGSEIKFDTLTQDISLKRLHGTFRIGRLVN